MKAESSSENSLDVRRSGEASEWLVRLREAPNDEATVHGWLRWCESDPDNAVAFERVQRMCLQIDRVLTDESAVAPSRTRSSDAWRRWGKAAGMAIAASGAVAAIALWLSQSGTPLEDAPALVQENRTATLPDGSLVELAAKTTVAVDFKVDQRLLRMSAGQAYFDVQPDKKRPFTVQAGELEVTAVGTAFDVKHQPGSIMVTVQEGTVAVSSHGTLRDTAGAAPWRVARGYQFVYSEASGTATLSSVDTSAVLAWREGRLEYMRTSLDVVVADINRYSLHPVEIEDPSVAALTFTGTVFTDSIDGWLTALPGALPVQVTRTAEGRVLLGAKRASVTTAVP